MSEIPEFMKPSPPPEPEKPKRKTKATPKPESLGPSQEDAIQAAFRAAREAEQQNYRSAGVPMSAACDDCMARMWRDLRWTLPAEVFTGQKLRIFETGNIEEDRVVASLAKVCDQVWTHDQNGRQYKAELAGGWLRGKVDAIVKGVPAQDPEEVFGVEIKSHNSKSFNHVVKYGVSVSKPAHHFQLQGYMRNFDLDRGIYAYVCKNDDDERVEIVERDDEFVDEVIGRVERVVEAENPPPKVSDDPDKFPCAYCRHVDHCHREAMPTERNCRTCVFSKPLMGQKYPTFQCQKYNMPLNLDQQKAGCEDHCFIPTLVPLEQFDYDERSGVMFYKDKEGVEYVDIGTGPIVPNPHTMEATESHGDGNA